MSRSYNYSLRTLQRAFEQLPDSSQPGLLFNEPINLLVDATFFSRHDGVLVFRANQKNLHWRFIESESLAEVNAGLDHLDQLGYHLQSVTLDGRKGMIQLFERRYTSLPIQLCQFHQTQIVRRYTTNNPKTDFALALKALMHELTSLDQDDFIEAFERWCNEFHLFLKERNEQGHFMHRRLRSARRSIRTNIPYLFTCKNLPDLNIPNTTNSCDGSFAHWKQKLKIHRGLRKHRRNKVINYLLKH